MKVRKKSNVVSFAVVATATVLMPLEQQMCFTHGFRSAIDLSTRTKPTIHIFHGRTIPSRSSSLVLSSANNAYGRGAEIWPESNNEAVQLSDSFPKGIVPLAASAAMEESDKVADTTEKERRPRRYIRRILKRAARKEKSFSSNNDDDDRVADKIPAIVALLLLVRGMARPADAALVASFTAYFTILNMTAESLRDSGAPILPAVPPQGHAPNILSNPLGLEKSTLYARWLKLGVLVGLVGPLASLFASKLPLEATQLVGRPLFLLCCQMATERTAKQNQVPLPLRVLIPVVYNASRLLYLWQWAFPSTALPLGRIGRALGIINAVYWAINLFAFLIPIASVRYMRAHFFGVEAEEVKTRIGLEETLGI
eukprot:CAMPEP_0116144790 /NCGR_PEP_ID=MMETSP0329-20121206/16210_1 /TAXON_ID=697910 /ORGANISM="Pseudo-nitzschia arenysensis, Strain B593" /LENGTH=368 /DNA_ID=CAMNT_0003640277 /DNA_START=52 /DNA_END=1155 /DNA_ORIENTATION=+